MKQRDSPLQRFFAQSEAKSALLQLETEHSLLSEKIQEKLASILGGPSENYENWSEAVSDLSRDVDDKIRQTAHRIRIAEVRNKRRNIEKKRAAHRKVQDIMSPRKVILGGSTELRNCFRAVIKEFEHTKSKIDTNNSHKSIPRVYRHRTSKGISRGTFEEPTTLFDITEDTCGVDLNMTFDSSNSKSSDDDSIRRGETVVIPSPYQLKRMVSNARSIEIFNENSELCCAPAPELETPLHHTQQEYTSHDKAYPSMTQASEQSYDNPNRSESPVHGHHSSVETGDGEHTEVQVRPCSQTDSTDDLTNPQSKSQKTIWQMIMKGAAKVMDSNDPLLEGNATTDATSTTDMKDNRLESDIYESESFKAPTLTNSVSDPKFASPPLMPRYLPPRRPVRTSEATTPTPAAGTHSRTPAPWSVSQGSLKRVPGTASQSDLLHHNYNSSGPFSSTSHYFQSRNAWPPNTYQCTPPVFDPYYANMRAPNLGYMPGPNETWPWSQINPCAYTYPITPYHLQSQPHITVSRGYNPQVSTPPTPSAFPLHAKPDFCPTRRRLRSGEARSQKSSRHVRQKSWAQTALQDIAALPQLFSSCSRLNA